MNEFNCFQLAEIDDFLTKALVDDLFYWTEVRKIEKSPTTFPTPSQRKVLRLVRKYTEEKNLNIIAESFAKLPETQKFLSNAKYSEDDSLFRSNFIKHTKKYFQIYSVDSGLEINTTDRYANKLESCIVARKTFEAGEVIKYLSGYLCELTDSNEILLNPISVIDTTRGGYKTSMMLGPLRFVNHDCFPNATFQSSSNTLKIMATRKILVGEQITTSYSNGYFGANNKNCKCSHCERNNFGFFHPYNRFTNLSFPAITNVRVEISDEGQEKDENEDDIDLSGEDSDLETKFNIITMEVRNKTMLSEESEPETTPEVDSDNRRVFRDRKPKVVKLKENETILSVISSDRSLDSFAELLISSDGHAKEIKRRRIMRSLHKLYMCKYYGNDYIKKHDIYDCRNCGTYFEGYKFNFARNHYCPRCERHYKIYDLCWPYTKESMCPYVNKMLNYNNIERLSINRIAQRKKELEKVIFGVSLGKSGFPYSSQNLRRGVSKDPQRITRQNRIKSNNSSLQKQSTSGRSSRTSLRVRNNQKSSYETLNSIRNEKSKFTERLKEIVLSNGRVIEETDSTALTDNDYDLR